MRDAERRGGWRREVPVLLAAIPLAVLLFVTPSSPGETAVLEAFLRDGPGPGVWEIESFLGRRRYLLGVDPGDRRCRVVAPLGEDGAVLKVRTVPRSRVAQWFVPGCRHRFLTNYRVADRRDEGGLRVAEWRPRSGDRGEAGRRVWFERESGRVVRLEDRSRTGEILLRVRRIGPVPPTGLPADPEEGATQACVNRATWERRHPPSVEEVAAAAPFGILRPTVLPDGFGLKEAAYRDDGDGAGVAWFTFTDGLASFALAMGPRANLEAFEQHFASSVERDDKPAPSPHCDGEDGGCSVRLRHAPRRVVMRVDDLHGLGVLLLGRNELLDTAYLRVLEGLEPIPARERKSE
jgi:hypothetical protein